MPSMDIKTSLVQGEVAVNKRGCVVRLHHPVAAVQGSRAWSCPCFKASLDLLSAPAEEASNPFHLLPH